MRSYTNLMEIEKRVFLLKMLKRDSSESLKDVIEILADTGVFTLKEGKKIRKELEKEGYIKEGNLTMLGVAEAKRAEEEFKL